MLAPIGIQIDKYNSIYLLEFTLQLASEENEKHTYSIRKG